MARRTTDQNAKRIGWTITITTLGVLLLVVAINSYKVVPAGHVGVSTFFGKINPQPYDAGLHFPVNPLLSWHLYDVRQKTHKEVAAVPSQDQLQTQVDVSVQYRLMESMAPRILGETGDAAAAVTVHLVPKVRSLLREQGKSIKRAEDFFQEETQQRLQIALLSQLGDFLADKGIEVTDVLIRDINLPDSLVKQIEQKKQTEQMAERQKAELERFKTEQEQLVAAAEAEKRAAQEEAERRKLIADAQAYEIEKINAALANSPGYIRLEALKALMSISKDPAAKMYFMNGDSPMPLPLMHMGEDIGPISGGRAQR